MFRALLDVVGATLVNVFFRGSGHSCALRNRNYSIKKNKFNCDLLL